jgi:cobalt/nickel transport system permease protein
VTASVICGVVALQLGAFSVVLETLLSGRSELPFGAFLFLMQPVHLAIGLVEGFVSAGVINFVKAARPEIIEGIASSRPLAADLPIRRVLAGLLIAALITGGMLSWFASANPDGLEWSIEKVFGRKELPEPEQGITPALKSLQDRTTVLPDYTVKKDGNKEETAGSDMGDSWPSTDAFTSISGVVGSLSVLGLILLLGLGIKAIRKRNG